MRFILALLLMMTGAQAQNTGFGSGIGLYKHPLGDLLLLTGQDVSGQGTVTARLTIENVAGRPLQIAADGDGKANIGTCSSVPSYTGLVAGYRQAATNRKPMGEALQPLPTGSRIVVTVQMTGCNLTAATTPVTLPIYVVDPVNGNVVDSLTLADLPVFPQ